jgi:ATP-dependent DNA ligase
MAKRLAEPYRSGERAMLKIKRMRTADCVVGGFRYSRAGEGVGSMLLGLYGEDGLLHHVGYTSAIPRAHKVPLAKELEALIREPGFTGRAPGGPSRWSKGQSMEWEPLEPRLVAEVRYDHFSGGRFRHGTAFLRWRPDKEPRQCLLEQVERASRSSLALITPDGG